LANVRVATVSAAVKLIAPGMLVPKEESVTKNDVLVTVIGFTGSLNDTTIGAVTTTFALPEAGIILIISGLMPSAAATVLKVVVNGFAKGLPSLSATEVVILIVNVLFAIRGLSGIK
jgi:hypothetical protein